MPGDRQRGTTPRLLSPDLWAVALRRGPGTVYANPVGAVDPRVKES